MSKNRILSLLVAACLPLAAAEPPKEFAWVSGQVGGTFFGDSLYKTQPFLGGTGGWWFSDPWGVEVRATWGDVRRGGNKLVAHQGVGTVSGLWKFWPGEFSWQPYLALGAGGTRNIAYGHGGGFFDGLKLRPAVIAGVGAYRRFGERGLVNLDYRAVHSGLKGTQYNDHQFSVGLGLTFGEPAAKPDPAPAPRVTPPPPPPPPPARAPEPPPVVAVPQPKPAPPPTRPVVRKKIQVKGAVVRFANGQAVLNDRGAEALEQVARSLKGVEGGYRVKVTGHASKVGPKKLNQRLSLKRAQAAADHLVEEGVPASAIQVEAKGAADPQADNRTRKGRALNRRAEVAVRGDDAVEVSVVDAGSVDRKVAKKAPKAGKKHAAKAGKKVKAKKAKK